MLGQKYPDQKRKALALVEKGVADVMLVPAWRKMIRYDGGEGGNLAMKEKKTVAMAARPQVSVKVFGRRLDLYENTHIELLLARNSGYTIPISLCLSTDRPGNQVMSPEFPVSEFAKPGNWVMSPEFTVYAWFV